MCLLEVIGLFLSDSADVWLDWTNHVWCAIDRVVKSVPSKALSLRQLLDNRSKELKATLCWGNSQGFAADVVVADTWRLSCRCATANWSPISQDATWSSLACGQVPLSRSSHLYWRNRTGLTTATTSTRRCADYTGSIRLMVSGISDIVTTGCIRNRNR